MQRDPQQTTLGRGVDREIEHDVAHLAVDDPLDPAAGLLEHEHVVSVQERHAIGWSSPDAVAFTSRSGSTTSGAGVCAAAAGASASGVMTASVSARRIQRVRVLFPIAPPSRIGASDRRCYAVRGTEVRPTRRLLMTLGA